MEKIATMERETAQLRYNNDEILKKFEQMKVQMSVLEHQQLEPLKSVHSTNPANTKMEETINRLSERLISLEKKPPPPQNTPSFADVVGQGTQQGSTSSNANSNQKDKQLKLLKSPYPMASRDVHITFANASSIDPTQQLQDKALIAVNDVLAKTQLHKRIFHGARFSLSKNLILTTGLHDTNENLAGYLVTIEDSLKFIGSCNAKLCAPWSKFLLHGVPTSMELDVIRRDVEEYCPGAKLGQTPRWLAPLDSRKDKTASTIVLAFLGVVTFSTLGGRTLRVGNRSCNLSTYIQYGSQTQCTNCQVLGHPKEFCNANPICVVCAGDHLTKDHQCPTNTCKGGYLCLHQPLKCSNCQGPHRASNRNCPVRVKKSQEFRVAIQEKVANRMC